MLFGRKSRAVESAAKDEDLAWRLDAIGQNVATIRFTPDGQILSANPLFLAVVGYSADELVGKHHRIFCDEDFQASAAYVRFWKELASGTPQRGVFRRLRRDGTPVWLEATYFPVKNAEGRSSRCWKIAADVTRNHSELLLLNAINDAIRQSMAVIEFTPDGEILDANENFLRLFGYSLKSLKGQHHRMLCFDEFYRENPDFWARLRHGGILTRAFRAPQRRRRAGTYRSHLQPGQGQFGADNQGHQVRHRRYRGRSIATRKYGAPPSCRSPPRKRPRRFPPAASTPSTSPSPCRPRPCRWSTPPSA